MHTNANDLARFAAFSNIHPSTLGRLSESSHLRHVLPGTVIFEQGQRAAYLILVLRGTVMVTTLMPDGHEFVTHIASGPCQPLDLGSVLAGSTHDTRAVAMTACTVAFIPKGSIREAARRDSALSGQLLRVAGEHLMHSLSLMRENFSLSVSERLLTRLSGLASARGRPAERGTLIDLPITQHALAAMIGSSRESANRAVRKLIRDGQLVRSGRYYTIAVAPNMAEFENRGLGSVSFSMAKR